MSAVLWLLGNRRSARIVGLAPRTTLPHIACCWAASKSGDHPQLALLTVVGLLQHCGAVRVRATLPAQQHRYRGRNSPPLLKLPASRFLLGECRSCPYTAGTTQVPHLEPRAGGHSLRRRDRGPDPPQEGSQSASVWVRQSPSAARLGGPGCCWSSSSQREISASSGIVHIFRAITQTCALDMVSLSHSGRSWSSAHDARGAVQGPGQDPKVKRDSECQSRIYPAIARYGRLRAMVT